MSRLLTDRRDIFNELGIMTSSNYRRKKTVTGNRMNDFPDSLYIHISLVDVQAYVQQVHRTSQNARYSRKHFRLRNVLHG